MCVRWNFVGRPSLKKMCIQSPASPTYPKNIVKCLSERARNFVGQNPHPRELIKVHYIRVFAYYKLHNTNSSHNIYEMKHIYNTMRLKSGKRYSFCVPVLAHPASSALCAANRNKTLLGDDMTLSQSENCAYK